MRILGFVISATVLHAVVLALSPDTKRQNVEEILVGVSLVQRQSDPLAATATGVHSPAQELLFENFTDHPVVDRADKVNVAERQEPDVDLVVQELPVETKNDTLEPAELLSDHGDETLTQPVQRQQQAQPPPGPVADTPPSDISVSFPEQASPPPADHPVVADDGFKLRLAPAEQGSLMPERPQTLDGVASAMKLSGEQVEAQPRYGFNPAPDYPGTARRRGWEGTVEFKIRVLTNGEVGEVTLKSSSGYKNLDDAARRAITRWRFTPASRAGRVIESWVVVPVHFVLDAQTHSR